MVAQCGQLVTGSSVGGTWTCDAGAKTRRVGSGAGRRLQKCQMQLPSQKRKRPVVFEITTCTRYFCLMFMIY